MTRDAEQTKAYNEAYRQFVRSCVAINGDVLALAHRHAQSVVAHLPKQCARCMGTGQFVTHIVNGKPEGPGGVCFRCGGKGRITDADKRRNYGYDNFYRKVSP